MSRPGGLGNARPADDEVNLLVAGVKADLENKAGRTFADLKPVSYATQVVAGINYFVKIAVAEGEYIHARIYRDLQRNVSVHSVQTGKSETDELEYF
uniref:Cysteine protease inhibitor n=1 Tax=Acanthamoeba castellanii TaxID=5755 RepID=G8IIS4_ACACA|nr:cysteine protease inhibitor [Acanthamoeba castellanii]